jgi:hypothetical protein
LLELHIPPTNEASNPLHFRAADAQPPFPARLLGRHVRLRSDKAGE